MINLNILLVAKLFLLSAAIPQGHGKNLPIQNDTNGAITKVSYNSTGGRGGNTVSMEITANIITYTQGHAGTDKTIRERTSRSLWMNLTRSINIKDFDHVKSNPGHAMYDGIDVTISVQKGRESHSIVNGNEDAVNYNRIGSFVKILVGQLDRLAKKINH